MADHNVKLTYSPSGFNADPFQVRVKPGHTIAFHLGPGSPNGTFRVTFRDRQFFSGPDGNFALTGVVHQGAGDVKVVAALSGPTTYHCELVDQQGNVIAQSNENQGGGGEITPDQ